MCVCVCVRHTCTIADDISLLHYLRNFLIWCVHHNPLTDTKHTYTYPNLSNVLKLVEYVGITDCLGIPYSVRRKIKERSKNKEQQQYECICYWRNVAPYSIIGWGFLGGMLHFYGQKTALSAANTFIQRAPGSMACHGIVFESICSYYTVYDHVCMFKPAVIYMYVVCM